MTAQENESRQTAEKWRSVLSTNSEIFSDHGGSSFRGLIFITIHYIEKIVCSVADEAVEPKWVIEEEHAAETGYDEEEGFATFGGSLAQAGAEELRHIPPDGVAECGTEGVGDEIIDITGAVGEQLGAFDEQGKACAAADGPAEAPPAAVEEGQQKAQRQGHENVEPESACEILQRDQADVGAENRCTLGIVQRGVEIAEAVDAELLENAQLQKNICEPAGAGDGVDHLEIQAKD